jgi:hypothetical protein
MKDGGYLDEHRPAQEGRPDHTACLGLARQGG